MKLSSLGSWRQMSAVLLRGCPNQALFHVHLLTLSILGGGLTGWGVSTWMAEGMVRSQGKATFRLVG